MTLPHAYITALLLTLLTMMCWGSWSNAVKVVKNWRFELLYFDYSFGILATALVLAFTFGTTGSDGPPFLSDLVAAGTGNIAYGFMAGVVFNLSNILVVGAIAVAGMGLAFPIGVGLALVVGVILSYLINPQGNPGLLFTGVALIIAAMVTDAIACRMHAARKAAGGEKGGPASNPESNQSAVRKGIILSVIGGVLMGTFYPLVELGKKGEGGLGPYAIGFVFALGIFLSTFVFNIYFMNVPIQGERLGIRDYFRGSRLAHLVGIIGGIVFCLGTVSSYVASSAPRELQVGPAVSYAIGQGSTMVGTFWGVFLWKEFAGGGPRVNRLLVLMFALFLIGLGLVAIAPLYAAH
jgi:glucose uptake protein